MHYIGSLRFIIYIIYYTISTKLSIIIWIIHGICTLYCFPCDPFASAPIFAVSYTCILRRLPTLADAYLRLSCKCMDILGIYCLYYVAMILHTHAVGTFDSKHDAARTGSVMTSLCRACAPVVSGRCPHRYLTSHDSHQVISLCA